MNGSMPAKSEDRIILGKYQISASIFVKDVRDLAFLIRKDKGFGNKKEVLCLDIINFSAFPFHYYEIARE